MIKEIANRIIYLGLCGALSLNLAHPASGASGLEGADRSPSASSKSLISVRGSSSPVFLDPEEIKDTFLSMLRGAQSEIVICSPYLSINALNKHGLLSTLESQIRSGTRILVITCASLARGKDYEIKALDALTQIKAHVIFRDKIHAKYVCIDNKEVLLGSFNWLSGSFDPKYRYYLLNMATRLEGEIAQAALRHCAAIAKEPAEEVGSNIVGNQTIYSSSKEIGALHSTLIKGAKRSLEISSPNLSYNLLKVSGFLDLLSERVRSGLDVTIYSDSEMDGSKPDAQQARLALHMAGIKLVLKKGIHNKFFIVDGNDLYFGSDNPLAGAGRDTGAGFWQELGVLMRGAEKQIAEIKRVMDLTATVLDVHHTPHKREELAGTEFPVSTARALETGGAASASASASASGLDSLRQLVSLASGPRTPLKPAVIEKELDIPAMPLAPRKPQRTTQEPMESRLPAAAASVRDLSKEFEHPEVGGLLQRDTREEGRARKLLRREEAEELDEDSSEEDEAPRRRKGRDSLNASNSRSAYRDNGEDERRRKRIRYEEPEESDSISEASSSEEEISKRHSRKDDRHRSHRRTKAGGSSQRLSREELSILRRLLNAQSYEDSDESHEDLEPRRKHRRRD
jgi:hypothetical protein